MITAISGAILLAAAILSEFIKSIRACFFIIGFIGVGLGGLITAQYYEHGWEEAVYVIVSFSVVWILVTLTGRRHKPKKEHE